MGKGGEASAAVGSSVGDASQSRLFFAVVASGIALGAAACSVTAVAEGEANGGAAPPSRIVATPSVAAVVGADHDASALTDAGYDAHASMGDGGLDASSDGGDAGWNPTK